jgi:hypothetical protein
VSHTLFNIACVVVIVGVLWICGLATMMAFRLQAKVKAFGVVIEKAEAEINSLLDEVEEVER